VSVNVDRKSLLVEAPGTATLRDVEDALAKEGLTLGVGASAVYATAAAWLASGAPGARNPFADPADHLVAGIAMTLANGASIDIRPSPRRAVGPDLVALVAFPGTRVDRVWLRAHVRDARVPSLPVPDVDRDPPLTAGESALVAAITRELAR
jgi:alkyldihydroxyacetonephosphate synthase